MKPTLDFLLERDGWVCGICHSPILGREAASVDHIIPRYHKGTDALWNTRATHITCNGAKAARLPHPREIRWGLIEANEAQDARRVIHRALGWKYPLHAFPPGTIEWLYGGTTAPPTIGQPL